MMEFREISTARVREDGDRERGGRTVGELEHFRGHFFRGGSGVESIVEEPIEWRMRKTIGAHLGWMAVSWLIAGCAGGGAGAGAGEMGDLSSEEPAVGGISEVPNPTPEMAAASGSSLETLQRGHVTYMLKCGECHNYMLPKDLFEDEWEDAVPEMIQHAGLQEPDEQAVLAYVLAVKQDG
ncbi:MAG: hypothetical protein ACQKBU_06270 [Verrucomicrobiales bacterium]